jgi:hypothetical protein
MMSTKRLLKDCTAILGRLMADGPSDDLLLEHDYLGEAMDHYRLRHEYEQARIAYAIHREFSDSEPPLTAQDIKNLNEASAMRREITQLIRKPKNRRKGAETPRDVADRSKHH